jgi:cytochrome c-type biogenesis protein CcmH/NrfF
MQILILDMRRTLMAIIGRMGGQMQSVMQQEIATIAGALLNRYGSFNAESVHSHVRQAMENVVLPCTCWCSPLYTNLCGRFVPQSTQRRRKKKREKALVSLNIVRAQAFVG